MGSEHYCLRWNNHQNNLLGVFNQLLRDESLVDVTLACSEGHSIRAHKVVLSACSSYFQTLFLDHPSRHPIVILKDVQFSELRTLVEFMYRGEVNVEYCQLSTLLKTADSLKIKGLAEMAPDYKESEETLLKEIITRRLANPTSRSLSADEAHQKSNSPSSLKSFRECKSPVEVDTERDEHIEPKDLSLGESTVPVDTDCEVNTNNMATTQCSINRLSICNTLTSPSKCDTLASSSKMTQIQEAPMSLKKETEWVSEDDKNFGSPTEYLKLSNDPELENSSREDSPHIYSCVYCGNTFPHQSKLTRHVLSHSLETLKYREQKPSSISSISEHSTYYDFSNKMSTLPHEPPDPTDQPPTQMDLDLNEAVSVAVGNGNGGVVLCKFCGKSFPDVSSLITHLPVHTGDRPFKCEFCGKAFKLRHHMKDHCRVHTGERPFRCTLCGKTFSRSTILKAHEKTHYSKYVRKFISPNLVDTEEDSPH